MAAKELACMLWLTAIVSGCSGLVCNVCDGVDTLDRCQGVETCAEFAFDRDSSQICQNDYRVVNNKVTMRKKCKPRKACLTEEKMGDNNCDENTSKDTVCRCCCETDNCNSQKKGCYSPSDCPILKKPDNGFIRCPARPRVGARCSYGCHKGYKIDGTRSVQCGRDRTSGVLVWKPSAPPLCVKEVIKCRPPHRTPKFGKMQCRNTGKYVDEELFNLEGSMCNFGCMENYIIKGQKHSRCKRDKKWSNRTPICVLRTCSVMPDIPKGQVICTQRNVIGSECTFSCEIGYTLVGDAKILCETRESTQSGAAWNAPAPRCEVITCGPAPNLANGKVNCTAGSDAKSLCTYSCNDGFDLSGTPQQALETECTQTGNATSWEWSRVPPSCSPIRCRPPDEPLHGRVICTNGDLKSSICSLQCDVGYYPTTTVSINVESECVDGGDGDAEGIWTAVLPDCTPTTCDRLEEPAGGILNCTKENFLDSVCSFTCEPGYRKESQSTKMTKIKCVTGDDGNAYWNKPIPTCSMMFCDGDHRAPEHGSVKCTKENELGSVCEFMCDDGYDLDGTKTGFERSTCADAGDGTAMWTIPAPTCSRIACSPVQEDLRRGSVTCTDRNFAGSICTFTCNEGFDISAGTDGIFQMTCIDDGNGDAVGAWTGIPPTSSFLQPTCKASCPPVQKKIQRGVAECTNANFEGSVCTFTCKTGFGINVIVGEKASLQCSDDGGVGYATWTAAVPSCTPISCTPIVPDNGFVTCTDANSLNSVCRYRCSPGHEFASEDKRKAITTTCLDDGDGNSVGEWSVALPQCIPIFCLPVFTHPPNGIVKCTNENLRGSVCSFRCNENYRFSGISDGTVTLRCSIVHGDEGNTDTILKWNGTAPVCSEACTIPIAPLSGSVTCTDSEQSGISVCRFSCDPGYYLKGLSEIRCNSNADGELWSGAPPICVAITCDVPKAPDGASVTCSNDNYIGSVCTYTCNDGDIPHQESEKSEVTCTIIEKQEIGEWIGSIPRCSLAGSDCEVPRGPKHGKTECTKGYMVGSVCTYSCNEGYDLAGTKASFVQSTCSLERGEARWSREPGNCAAIRCRPKDASPSNGQVICTNSNMFGSSCVFTCDEGYYSDNDAAGDWSSECVDDGDGDEFGQWSQLPGKCIIKQCYPPHSSPQNGLVLCSDENNIKSECTFSCNPGFQLHGEVKSSCLDLEHGGHAEAEWDHEAPTCEVGTCGHQAFDLETVSRDCGPSNDDNEKKVGTECAYSCKLPGYYLDLTGSQFKHLKNGDLVAKCLIDQTWSTYPPVCSTISCYPVLKAPIFGYAPRCANTNKFRSACNFTCLKGYGLTHTYPLTCRSRGKNGRFGRWDNAIPTCIRQGCPVFRDLSHGKVEYSHSTFVGSVAHLLCSEGYVAKLHKNATCLRPTDVHQPPHWNNASNFCCVRCLRNTDLKFVAVLDKTAAHDNAEWMELIKFLESAVYEMRTNGFNVNFSLVLYGEEIDASHSLPLRSNDESDDLSIIINEIKGISGAGDDSNTGRALVYANEVMFPSNNVEEQPYLILAIGGKSKDEVKEAAKKIREKDINVLAVSVNSNGNQRFVDTKYLMGITGKRENIFSVGSPRDLQQARERIAQIAKENGCKIPDTSQACPD